MSKEISKSTLRRLPTYLGFLKQLDKQNVTFVSSRVIAEGLHLNEVQVRKDIAFAASCSGKPKLGHLVKNLINDIEKYLGYNHVTEAVIIGAGQLGRALISYKGFIEYGLDILMAFDTDKELIGKSINGTRIYDMKDLENRIKLVDVKIGIITVNASAAQVVCDQLIKCGIEAIWNFAPTHLRVPKGILVQNENMAASLAILSKHLSNKSKKEL